MIGAGWGSVIVLAQLGSATIDIQVTDSVAVVDAQYSIVDAAADVRVVVMRFAGQGVEWLDAPGFSMADGLYEATVPASRSRLRVRYAVTGNLERIPLPVPSVPLIEQAEAVSIRVTGGESFRLDDTFPRFARDGAGMLARPSSVPTFVRVPGGNRLFTNPVADGMVLALVLLAVVLGLWRAWSRHRPVRA